MIFLDNVSILVAFSAGLLSFLSPCVLPLVPAYITYLTGTAIAELNTGKAKLYALYKSIGFVIGFSIIFILMGASISTLGRLFAQHQDIFRKAGGILIIIFGIHISGLFKIKYLYYEKKLLPQNKPKGSWGSVFMGMAFAAGWTPCVGPILASILIYAGSMATINKGILLLTIYSLGLAVPFIITAVLIGSFSEYLGKLNRYLPAISEIGRAHV